jgi:hypothetical protein
LKVLREFGMDVTGDREAPALLMIRTQSVELREQAFPKVLGAAVEFDGSTVYPKHLGDLNAIGMRPVHYIIDGVRVLFGSDDDPVCVASNLSGVKFAAYRGIRLGQPRHRGPTGGPSHQNTIAGLVVKVSPLKPVLGLTLVPNARGGVLAKGFTLGAWL